MPEVHVEMWKTSIEVHGDVPRWLLIAAVVLAGAALVLLVTELRRIRAFRIVTFISGVLASAALVLAVARPDRITAQETQIPPRVAVLIDGSRSARLPDGRAAVRDSALAALARSMPGARLDLLEFGAGALRPYTQGATAQQPRSDFRAALESLAESQDARPDAVVVIADGRFTDVDEQLSEPAALELASTLHVPLHTIATALAPPPDASIRRVRTTGTAFAHVPFVLHVEVGCEGGVACEDLTVQVREMRHEGDPTTLGSAAVKLQAGAAAVDVPITLERAGTRILEVSIGAVDGDSIAENNSRFVTLDVARERVRVLHVSGRPTTDARTLRRWLKGNAALDVIAFFILRTHDDDAEASPQDLALIPFPVDELFQQHLASFDAIILQDFDARPYGLLKHLPALANYVRRGGGLVLVGGPTSFGPGGYGRSALAPVLPTEIPVNTQVDEAAFTPDVTPEGRMSPILQGMARATQGKLPILEGANLLGDIRPDATALWVHPTLKTATGKAMPMLAVADVDAGRSIAVGVDGTHRLTWSPLGAATGGRGYELLWDGLMGWLMHDARFEPMQLHWLTPCSANHPTTLALYGIQDPRASLQVLLHRAGDSAAAERTVDVTTAAAATSTLVLPALEAGAYALRVRSGNGPWLRREFACEVGGDEWADSRPDPQRLQQLAKLSHGQAFGPADSPKIPLPDALTLIRERSAAPLLPPWAWCAMCAALLGAHWMLRRRAGLV